MHTISIFPRHYTYLDIPVVNFKSSLATSNKKEEKKKGVTQGNKLHQ